MSSTEASELPGDSKSAGVSFKIMCVIDPRTCHELSEIRQWIHQDWHPANLKKELARSLLKNTHTKEFIYRCEDVLEDSGDKQKTGKHLVSVIMHEWLYILAVGLPHRNPLRIEFMKWTKFSRLLLKDPDALGKKWQKSGIDCFIGGADLQVNIGSEFYDLGHKSDRYKIAITKLEHYVAIWPNPDELQRAGRKMDRIIDLNTIAANMNTARPITMLIDSPSQRPAGYVVKREYSDCCSHVFLLNNDPPDDILLKEPGYRWFAQEYAPLLQQWGEFRTHVVGGQIIDTVLTKTIDDGNWTWCIMNEWYSLAELGEMLTENAHTTSREISSRTLGNQDELRYAKKEYEDFVLGTWNRLRTLEEAETKVHSSLNEFCRIDVGVIRRGDDMHYFVNEVERGPATSIWSRDDPILAGKIGPQLGVELTKWLTSLRRYKMERT